MAVGISVYNDKNTLQIDDRGITYGLVDKYTTTDLNNSENKVCAYSPTVAGGKIHIRTLKTSAPQPNNIDVFVFGKPSTPDNFGLQVFRADGTVAFHSGYKPIRVVDFIRTPILTPQNFAEVFTKTKTYAGYGRLGVVVGSSTLLISTSSNMNSPIQVAQPLITITGNTVEFSWYVSSLPPSARDSVSTVPSGYNEITVVDLTNY